MDTERSDFWVLNLEIQQQGMVFSQPGGHQVCCPSLAPSYSRRDIWQHPSSRLPPISLRPELPARLITSRCAQPRWEGGDGIFWKNNTQSLSCCPTSISPGLLLHRHCWVFKHHRWSRKVLLGFCDEGQLKKIQRKTGRE